MKKLINDNKVKVVCAVCTPLSALFVPAGWIWTDISMDGAVLTGVRKSFFLDTAVHKETYGWIEGVFRTGGRDVFGDRLLEIVKMIP